MESILRRHDVYDGLVCREALSDEVEMRVNIFPLTRSKYSYSKKRKGVYVIFIYNSKILLRWTLDEQTGKERYASTWNETHDQKWLT